MVLPVILSPLSDSFSDEDEPNIPGLDFDEAQVPRQNVYQVEINMELIDNGLEITASGGGIGYGRYLVNYPTRNGMVSVCT